MDTFYEKLRKRIKTIREKMGLSQEQLAEDLDISRVAVSQIENGGRQVSAEEIAKLSKLFNMSIDVLVICQLVVIFSIIINGSLACDI